MSNLGTWMQFTALGYEVVRLAPTSRLAALYVGLQGASRAVPVLLLSPFAGVVADRYPRRAVLLATNIATALLALALAIVIGTGHASIAWIMLLSGLQAATQSFDAPARQSWVPLLVPREMIGRAIGLNSIAFNAPAVAGPPLAGILIAGVGVAPCMYANALFTLAVVVALLFMQPVGASSTKRDGVREAIREGITYLRSHPVLRWIVLLLVLIALTVRPYLFLLPAYAAHTLHTDARGLGLLMAAAGVGAIFGAVLTAAAPKRRAAIWTGSAVLLASGMIALGSTTNFIVALCVLPFMGFATLSFIGTTNILMQTLSPDDLRGRVISVYSMIILGLVPVGSLVLGSIASLVGLPETYFGSGVLGVACAVWIYAAHPSVRAV